MPQGLRDQLVEAAELHSITNLRQHLTALDALGQSEKLLAEHLRHLSSQYDMSGIKRVLETVERR